MSSETPPVVEAPASNSAHHEKQPTTATPNDDQVKEMEVELEIVVEKLLDEQEARNNVEQRLRDRDAEILTLKQQVSTLKNLVAEAEKRGEDSSATGKADVADHLLKVATLPELLEKREQLNAQQTALEDEIQRRRLQLCVPSVRSSSSVKDEVFAQQAKEHQQLICGAFRKLKAEVLDLSTVAAVDSFHRVALRVSNDTSAFLDAFEAVETLTNRFTATTKEDLPKIGGLSSSSPLVDCVRELVIAFEINATNLLETKRVEVETVAAHHAQLQALLCDCLGRPRVALPTSTHPGHPLSPRPATTPVLSQPKIVETLAPVATPRTRTPSSSATTPRRIVPVIKGIPTAGGGGTSSQPNSARSTGNNSARGAPAGSRDVTPRPTASTRTRVGVSSSTRATSKSPTPAVRSSSSTSKQSVPKRSTTTTAPSCAFTRLASAPTASSRRTTTSSSTTTPRTRSTSASKRTVTATTSGVPPPKRSGSTTPRASATAPKPTAKSNTESAKRPVHIQNRSPTRHVHVNRTAPRPPSLSPNRQRSPGGTSPRGTSPNATHEQQINQAAQRTGFFGPQRTEEDSPLPPSVTGFRTFQTRGGVAGVAHQPPRMVVKSKPVDGITLLPGKGRSRVQATPTASVEDCVSPIPSNAALQKRRSTPYKQLDLRNDAELKEDDELEDVAVHQRAWRNDDIDALIDDDDDSGDDEWDTFVHGQQQAVQQPPVEEEFEEEEEDKFDRPPLTLDSAPRYSDPAAQEELKPKSSAIRRSSLSTAASHMDAGGPGGPSSHRDENAPAEQKSPNKRGVRFSPPPQPEQEA